MEGWEIALIVVFSLLIMGAAIFGVVYWKKRRDEKNKWAEASSGNANWLLPRRRNRKTVNDRRNEFIEMSEFPTEK